MSELLARIVAPHFVAGIILRDAVVVEAAAIVGYMRGWSAHRVAEYCKSKRWEIARVPARSAA